MTLAAALARQPGGAFGAVAENALLTRLGLSVGDRIRVGEASLVLKALLEAEPDLASGAFKLGPRVIVSDAALAATGLVRPGSLTRNHTRVLYRPGTDSGTFEEELTRAFPNAGWRVRNVRDGAPRMRRFVDRLGLFFTLIGLTALLVGGIGVGGAVKGWLDAKRETIATLKCLGATGGFVFAVFALEVAAISGLGIALGLAAGAGIAMAASTLAADWAPVTIGVSIHVAPLGIAAAYGIAVAVLFTLAPLARAREVPAAALFRALVDRPTLPPTGRALHCGSSVAP
jgi:putative ABC transport system permease protein